MRIVNSNLYAKYKPGTSHSAGLRFIYKAALVLFRPQADRQTTTINNSGLPQDSRLFTEKPRDLPSRQSSGAWAATSVQ